MQAQARPSRPTFTLLAVCAGVLLAALAVLPARAQPRRAGTDIVIQLTLVADVAMRPAADPTAAPVRIIQYGTVVYLTDVARDNTGAVWYRVALADGTDLGWLPREAARIENVSYGSETACLMFGSIGGSPCG